MMIDAEIIKKIRAAKTPYEMATVFRESKEAPVGGRVAASIIEIEDTLDRIIHVDQVLTGIVIGLGVANNVDVQVSAATVSLMLIRILREFKNSVDI